MEENFITYLKNAFQLQEIKFKNYSPLTLAYIGDGIYDLVIRSIVVYNGNCPANKLHRKTSKLVKAETQSAMIRVLREHLTEEELAVFRRGRNAYSPTRAKHATMSDYRHATGFEALMGYLYLAENYSRMLDLIKMGLEGIGEPLCDTKK